jgi:hypothetical protein
MLPIALLMLSACDFTPESGSYRLVPAERSTDCPEGQELLSREPTTVDVRVAEDARSFTMQDAGVDTPYVFACGLEDAEFSCPVLERTEIPGAVATVEASVTGNWSEATTFSLAMVATASCEGDSCAYLEQQGFVPCSVSLTARASQP